jgi:hypothetical protein
MVVINEISYNINNYADWNRLRISCSGRKVLYPDGTKVGFLVDFRQER